MSAETTFRTPTSRPVASFIPICRQRSSMCPKKTLGSHCAFRPRVSGTSTRRASWLACWRPKPTACCVSDQVPKKITKGGEGMLPAFFLFARRQFPYTVVLPACGAHHQHIFRFFRCCMWNGWPFAEGFAVQCQRMETACDSVLGCF